MRFQSLESRADLFRRFCLDISLERGPMEEFLTRENLSRALGINSVSDWERFVELIYPAQPDYAKAIANLFLEGWKAPSEDWNGALPDVIQTLGGGDLIELYGFNSAKEVEGKYLVLDLGETHSLISYRGCEMHADLVFAPLKEGFQNPRRIFKKVIEGGRLRVDHPNKEFFIYEKSKGYSKEPGWHSYRLVHEAFPEYSFRDLSHLGAY